MPDHTPRSTLEAYFAPGQMPRALHFQELIQVSLNQADDGIQKSSTEALKIQAAQDAGIHEEAVLKLYADFTQTEKWQLSLNVLNADGSAEENRGLNLADADGHSRLFIEEADGNVGIGTTDPDARLHVVGRIKDQTGFVMPVGSILAYGGAAAPEGWLLCDGQDISSGDQFEELRTILGTTHVPDLRSRFVVGAGKGNSLSEYPINNIGGEEQHVLSTEEMPPHNHHIAAYHANFQHHGVASESSLKDDGDGPFSHWTDEAGGQGGAAAPHENRPPYYALTYMIKY